jgi:hypothetical protein
MFDLVFYNDILHHVDISRTLGEARRVLKSGADVVVNELYTHSSIQRIRNSALITKVLYPRVVKLIYGSDNPYITADERKLDERELDRLGSMLTDVKMQFFLLMEGRLFPGGRWPALSRFDRALLKAGGHRLGRLLAGRFVMTGKKP